MTSNIWNFQMFLHTIAATQEVPRHSRLHLRGSTSDLQQEEPRFSLIARDEGSFPCFVQKEIQAFPSHLKRRRSQQERREELQGRDTIPRVPQMFQSIPEEPVFLHSLTFTPRIDSHHGGTWDSPVGKPRGNASRESHRYIEQGDGKVTLLLQLGRKVDVHAATRDED